MTILQYIKPIWEGDDGKISGKRVLGVLLVISGIILGVDTHFKDCNCIPNEVLLIGTFLTAGLAFWGITSAENYFHKKLDSDEDSPTK